MSTSRRMGILALLVSSSLLVSGGCSWTLVRAPKPTYSPHSAERPPECTSGQAPPILDTLDAVGSGGVMVLGAVWTTEGTGRRVGSAVGPVTLGAGILSTLLYSVSAGYGYSETSTCRRLKNDFQASVANRGSGGGEPGEERPEEDADEQRDDESLADKEILSIVEAAELCGVERSVIRDGLSSGELNGLQTDRGYELPRAEVVKYCAGLE